MFNEVVDADSRELLWAAERALKILQSNYRIGRPELVAMEQVGAAVIDRDFATKVVLWFVEYDLVNDVVKKRTRRADLFHSWRAGRLRQYHRARLQSRWRRRWPNATK